METPYDRGYGKPYHGELFRFGSVMLFRVENNPAGGLMAERWSTGVGWVSRMRRMSTWFGQSVQVDRGVPGRFG